MNTEERITELGERLTRLESAHAELATDHAQLVDQLQAIIDQMIGKRVEPANAAAVRQRALRIAQIRATQQRISTAG